MYNSLYNAYAPCGMQTQHTRAVRRYLTESMKNKTIKGITLLLFFTLIIVFVMYRTSYFTNKEAVNTNSSDSHTENIQTDTILPVDSTLTYKPIISSSKSVIIFNPEVFNSTEIDSTLLDSIKQ
ncbi:hypothetical protein [Ascidiimonas sp. W6]|uniref:hypothetical protein n=1 Tax=Ascidiimonas meishanensis TaxID=3128903 RepID=UPI0030EEDC1B